ncbi:CubicO group peptidase (beta-lactamase class C family) [Chryseobacterium sp. 52]|uniref:serine hydrolase domain-containing protein n=1 Tax=Chryseobacterium sp. 52 TaxID=2035213 RepID=UPI000C17E5E7|nr:serine hydrolase domain-containing protein [Chryseobacterium sp. 52]PIF46636.1 CubicO group peptidase (beta-lactamase class C family) [Chryseobacterium sp. 52]
MKNLKIYLALIIVLAGQSISAQIKTIKGKNISAKQMETFIKNQMDSLDIRALSIALIANDKIVYHKAVGTKNIQKEPVDNQTIFEAASMTKPIFAYVVLKLAKENILNLDTPLYTYYPYKDIAYDDRYKLITARMVLDHSTGFPNRRENNKLTINFTPGTKFDYSGEGYEYLAQVVEHLTGKKTDKLIEEYALKPMSIKNSYMSYNEYVAKHLTDGIKENNERARNEPYLQPNVAYSLYTDSQEYAKFVARLIKESNTSNSIFQSMATPQLEIHEPDMDPNLKMSIGLGVFVQKTPYGLKYFHGGSNGNCYNSLFQLYRDSKMGAVYFIAGCKQYEFAKRLDEFLIRGR